MDCGATCLRMIASFYGKEYSIEYLRELTHLTREGVSFADISEAAEQIGIRTLAVKIGFDRLITDIPLPCIAHWNQDHFVVIYQATEKTIVVGDPSKDLIKMTKNEFLDSWAVGITDG